MPHDKHTITISRFDGSKTWAAAIQPSDRKWVVYVDTNGDAHLYERREDVTDAATGDTMERYVHIGSTGSAGLSGLIITISQDPATQEPGSHIPTPWIARSNVVGACARAGKTPQEAVVGLFEEIESRDAEADLDTRSVAALAL